MAEQLKDIPIAHLVPVQGELRTEEQEASGVLKEIDAMLIEDQEDLDFAGSILTEVKGKKKRLENERGKATRPLLDALNVIRGWFRPAVQYLDQCEKKLKSKIAAYHRQQRQRQQAALQAAGEASMRGDAEVARTQMQEAQQAQVHKVAGVSTREVLKWDVEDLSKVPREFLMINAAAVDAYFAERGFDGKISGIRTWRDVSVAGRAAK